MPHLEYLLTVPAYQEKCDTLAERGLAMAFYANRVRDQAVGSEDERLRSGNMQKFNKLALFTGHLIGRGGDAELALLITDPDLFMMLSEVSKEFPKACN